MTLKADEGMTSKAKEWPRRRRSDAEEEPERKERKERKKGMERPRRRAGDLEEESPCSCDRP
jgi:hypothetical protein